MKRLYRWIIFALLLTSSCTPSGPHTLDGTAVPDVLAAYPSTHVVLVYWWESCPYCKQELAEINEVYDDLQQANVTVVALNVGDSDDLVRRTVAERGYTFPVVAGYTVSDLPALGVPYTEIYLNGDLTARRVGYTSLVELGGLIFLGG